MTFYPAQKNLCDAREGKKQTNIFSKKQLKKENKKTQIHLYGFTNVFFLSHMKLFFLLTNKKSLCWKRNKICFTHFKKKVLKQTNKQVDLLFQEKNDSAAHMKEKINKIE